MNKGAEKQIKTKLKKRQWIVLLVMMGVLLSMLVSYAWYFFQTDKEVDTELADVMAPYYLYLLDQEGDSLSLTIGSLHPGETKEVLIGVSNKPAGQNGIDYLVGKDSEFSYQMVLAYTQNLPITYQVYELQQTDEGNKDYTIAELETGNPLYLKKTLVTKDETESASLTTKNNQEMYGENGTVDVNSIVNYVQYDMYPLDASDEPLKLTTKLNGNITSYEQDYYLVEMEWEDGIEFQNFIKETDLVYVIVDAVQPEPEVSNLP